MRPSARFIVATILVVSVSLGSYALWRYHSRQIDRALQDGLLLGEASTVFYLATALGKMNEGDDQNARKVLELGLGYTLENASGLTSSGAELGGISVPNFLDSLGRAEAVTDDKGRQYIKLLLDKYEPDRHSGDGAPDAG